MSFEVELQSSQVLSPSTRYFRFVPTDGRQVIFQPGQFFRFAFIDHQGKFERSYSLCNDATDIWHCYSLDLLISTVTNGRASELLFSSSLGLKAQVTGPFGRLLIPEPLPERLFLLATSVGIAPYIPILSQLQTPLAKGKLEVFCLYGVREPDEFVYGERLMTLAVQHSNFYLIVCYSRKLPQYNEKHSEHHAYRGYVQSRLKALHPVPTSDHILLCGNPHMIDEAYIWLKQQGFGVSQVTREKYVYARGTQGVKPVTQTAMTLAQQKLLMEKMKQYQ